MSFLRVRRLISAVLYSANHIKMSEFEAPKQIHCKGMISKNLKLFRRPTATMSFFGIALVVLALGAESLAQQTGTNTGNDGSSSSGVSSETTLRQLPRRGSSLGEERTQTTGPSADEIIRVLMAEPSLVAEVKTQVIEELARRGLRVTEDQLTDDRLFSQIRANSEVRNAVGSVLTARGYFPDSADQAEKSRFEPPREELVVEPVRPVRPRGGKDGAAQRSGAPQATSRPNPYRGVPSLDELYKQYSAKSGDLERFGSTFFSNKSAVTERSVMDIPLGSSYILGPGDELSLNLSGAISSRMNRTVDREGRISLPEAGTLLVAGRTLADAQLAIQEELRKQYKDIVVDVSMNRLRRVRVYVVGDVVMPGAYDISALSTPLTALLLAGGPSPAGSMRSVSVFRDKKHYRDIDLYELMLKGVRSGEDALQSGDSLLVKPAGREVAVAGMVRRPAIYELTTEKTLSQVLALAGGVLVSGELSNVKVERTEAHRGRVMINVNLQQGVGPEALSDFLVQDGDRITIAPILPYKNQVVFLQGHVFRPGEFPFREGMTVLDLVQDFQNMLPEPADRAEVVRLQAPDYRPSVLGFDLREVLEKRQPPVKLEPFDTVRVFGRYEADAPRVSIYGEVLRPGEYPLSDKMTAGDLVRLAGGFRRSAYRKSADLSSYTIEQGDRVVLDHREVDLERALAGEEDTDIRLKAGDVLTVRQLGQWSEIGGSISISGAVLYPGRYGIQQGEKLSSVLRRAGGFLQEAYPRAAVLERSQVRDIAARSKEQLIQRLESQVLDAGAAGTQSAQQRKSLIDRLRGTAPSGRLVISITPQMSEWENTAADIEVRPGDTLVIPKQPNFVVVDGQVYSASALTFEPGKSAGWYLRQAGGPTRSANRKDIFIVRANGSVIGRDSGSWWSGGVLSVKLNPGDTVVVPEKIVGGTTFWQGLVQSAQVISAIAIAAGVATNF